MLVREANKYVPEGMKGSPDELFNFFKKMDEYKFLMKHLDNLEELE